MKNLSILIVEDEQVIAMELKVILERFGYTVAGLASSGEDAILLAQKLEPDLILMDIVLSGEMDGVTAAREILKSHDVPVIYVTANADMETVKRARDTRPYAFLNKPISERDLFSNIDAALTRNRIAKRLRGKEQKYQNIIEEIDEIIYADDTDTAGRLSPSRAVQALKESEERFRAIFENARDGIFCVDMKHKRTVLHNEMMREMLGYSNDEMKDITIYDIHPPDDIPYVIDQFERQAKKEIVLAKDIPVRRKDGSLFYADVSSSPVVLGGKQCMLGIFRDITERRKTQELMVLTEKMMTIGSLAAGMAHEINNPLGIVLQGMQATLSKLSSEFSVNRERAERLGVDLDSIMKYLEESDILEYFDGIREAGTRASRIVTNMLQFSRQNRGEQEEVDINELIENVLDLATKDYNLKKRYDFKNVKVVRSFDTSLPRLTCLKTEIEQVVLNLLKNASHAMAEGTPSGKVPEITISTKMDGDNIVLSISDNGPGIDTETLSHIFEPFYTTKSVGEGTGLGLAVSHHIIIKHGGTIQTESPPGGGASFIITLPLRTEATDE